MGKAIDPSTVLDDEEDGMIGEARGGDGRKLGKTDNRKPRAAGNDAVVELRRAVERIQRLEEDKKAVADDIKEVFAELKGRGFDVKAVRKLLAEMKLDDGERQEFESIMDVYRHAMGLI